MSEPEYSLSRTVEGFSMFYYFGAAQNCIPFIFKLHATLFRGKIVNELKTLNSSVGEGLAYDSWTFGSLQSHESQNGPAKRPGGG